MRHGFLLIDKPDGPTSHDVVSTVRRALPEKKVGHLGTLDPAATGLLVLAVGAKALKVIELFSNLTKEYEADICFGSVSATFDREGPIEEVVRKPGVKDPDDNAVLQTIRSKFIGDVTQVPPVASAVHVDGERAYKAMRQGKVVKMPERTVQIENCDILSYAYPNLTLRISCSSGTYIRSLANDLGDALHVGGYLSALRRTKVGEWNVENAVKPEDVAWGHIIPLKEVLAGFPRIDLSQEEFNDITHGRFIQRECDEQTFGWFEGLPVALLEQREEGIKARKVL